jgi:hypothetical protein
MGKRTNLDHLYSFRKSNPFAKNCHTLLIINPAAISSTTIFIPDNTILALSKPNSLCLSKQVLSNRHRGFTNIMDCALILSLSHIQYPNAILWR